MRVAILVVLLGLIATPALAATQDIAVCRDQSNEETQIAACTRVIDDQAIPDDERTMALYYRGTAYQSKRALDEALADFTALLRGHQIGLVYANRGLVYQWIGDFDRSIADLDQALRLDPSLSQAHKWRGVAYFNINKNTRALDDFNAAIRLDPKDTEAYYQRAGAYEIAGDLKSALADYDEYLKRDPQSARIHVRRGAVFVELGDLSRAIADAGEAMRIEPDNFGAFAMRGNAYRAKGDLDRAIDDYTAAIRIRGFSQMFHERGVAYRMKGDRAHAIDDFKYAVRLLPKDSPDSLAELKALGVDMSGYDNMKMPKAKDLLDSLE